MRRYLPFLILIIGALSIYVDLPGSHFFVLSTVDAGIGQSPETRLGLDLKGGYQVTYQIESLTRNGQTVSPDSNAMETIRGIIENRVNTTGVVEPVVETQGGNELVVQVPGAANPEEIKQLVGQQGTLEFVPLPKDQYGTTTSPGPKTAAQQSQIDATLPPLFDGSQLDPSGVTAANEQDGWGVNFLLRDQANKLFGDYTTAHTGEFFAIVLDGTVISAPSIREPITGGKGRISGSFQAADAKQLATILQYGALPFPIKFLNDSFIPATLGQSFLSQTLFAGAIGILLVMLFMLLYYRLPGLVACLALTYYGVAVLAVFRIIPVTLTLAGIAGFVLSVGMAVDANILIFERTKEELRAGKTLATAVEAGFNRALNSIIDSNVSSLITASILYFGGSSTIKGFALVLIIGVATSMFTAVTVSRTLLRGVIHLQTVQKAWLFGVSDDEFLARAMVGRFARREDRGRV